MSYFQDLPEDAVHEALKPPAPWDAGYYNATINEAIEYQGENSDFPCVKLTVTVANDQGKTKQLMAWVLSRNPKAATMGIQFLDRIGLVRDGKVLYTDNPQELVGRSGRVQVEIKDGFNRIKNFVKPR